MFSQDIESLSAALKQVPDSSESIGSTAMSVAASVSSLVKHCVRPVNLSGLHPSYTLLSEASEPQCSREVYQRACWCEAITRGL